MNIIYMMALFIASVTLGFGQISTIKVNSSPAKALKVEYDSTTNFLGENPTGYIGQELYLKGQSESQRQSGYLGFRLDYKKPETETKNIYKSNGMYASKYADIAEKYFEVLDVIPHPKSPENKYLYGAISYLKLREKSKGDILYYEYDSRYEIKFPFITIGFFEKAKKNVLGRTYVFKDAVLATSKDVQTGSVVSKVTGQKWSCTDLTVEEKYYSLSLVIINEVKEKTTIDYDYVYNSLREGRVYYETEVLDYNKRFGPEVFFMILKGEVGIGMTKEMCRLAWGLPDDINSTQTLDSTSDQWVYDTKYLYFTNGKLTTIQ